MSRLRCGFWRNLCRLRQPEDKAAASDSTADGDESDVSAWQQINAGLAGVMAVGVYVLAPYTAAEISGAATLLAVPVACVVAILSGIDYSHVGL